MKENKEEIVGEEHELSNILVFGGYSKEYSQEQIKEVELEKGQSREIKKNMVKVTKDLFRKKILLAVI